MIKARRDAKIAEKAEQRMELLDSQSAIDEERKRQMKDLKLINLYVQLPGETTIELIRDFCVSFFDNNELKSKSVSKRAPFDRVSPLSDAKAPASEQAPSEQDLTLALKPSAIIQDPVPSQPMESPNLATGSVVRP